MKKIFHFDCETTGIDPKINDIIQMAYIIEVDGEIKEEGEIKVQPHSYENISQKAVEVHGITIEDMKQFDPPRVAHEKILAVLGRYVDKYNRYDKYYPAGYNCSFDLSFMSEFFAKCGDKYFGSWVNWRRIDPLPMLYVMDLNGDITLPNYKLETVCEHFGVEIKAHDAVSDIRATSEILKILLKKGER